MQQQQNQPTDRHLKPPRLKIVLLGSAGAGKTSLLRRFVNGTFHGDVASSKGRRQRHTLSTLGADYYVKRMKNPLYGNNTNKHEFRNHCQCRRMAQDASRDRCSIQPKKRPQPIHTESHVFVQLWDTRGSEPSLPRWNHKQMQFNMYQFLSLRDKTKDAPKDEYQRYGVHLHRYNNWGMDLPSKWEGCMDFNVPKPRLSNLIRNRTIKDGMTPLQRRNSSPNALLDNIDACMLVYDATSSTSFLRLMTCHAECIKRFQQQQQQSNKSKSKRVPFIVVANKIDLLDEKKNLRSTKSATSQRRSVMGFDTYRGMEETYEYAAENASSTQCDCRCIQCHSNRCLGDNVAPLQKSQKKKLTYSLKETCWSSDSHYLRSIQDADDRLGANRTMVLLWCERNGIQHVEVSALDGRGVNLAMEELVRLGVQERMVREDYIDNMDWKDDRIDVATNDEWQYDKQWRDTGSYDASESIANNDTITPNQEHRQGFEYSQQLPNLTMKDNSQTFLYEPKYDKKLDLFERYLTKEDKRCKLKCWGC